MFSKSKRFVDKGKYNRIFSESLHPISLRVSDNGVPAVGSYDVRDNGSAVSHSFIKSDRFNDAPDLGTNTTCITIIEE